MKKSTALSIKEGVVAESHANASSVATILTDVQKKARLEEKAYKALERRLEPRFKMCPKCKGEGTRKDGEACYNCQGEGAIMEDADMRAVELVLAPKFPKTQININADIEGMTTDQLLDMVDGM